MAAPDEGRRIISQGVRNAVAGPIADVVQKHRKDPMVHSETIADFIINRLLESDGLLADLLGDHTDDCAICGHDKWMHSLSDNGRCIPECGCREFKEDF